MPNRKISQFSTVANLANVWAAGYDLTRPSGDQNVKFAAAGLGNPPIVTTTLGIEIELGASVDVQLTVPASPINDVSVLGLILRSPSLAAGVYNLQIYAGNPSGGGTLLFDYAATTTVNIGSDGNWTYSHPELLYLPASGGSNQLWVRLFNADITTVLLSAQAITIEYPGHGAQLPVWVDPPPYTGPLMDEVFVGPTRQFIEPRFALQALKDGGTMHIDPGTYYYPFGITWDPSIATDLRFGYNSGQPGGQSNRFINGITIIGSGTYNATPTIFNGRGGYGLQATHPFRLIRGQGFIWANSPVTISDIRFMFCGGNDQDSDGEAGIYALNFQTLGTVTVTRCAFDGNENGIFAQFWHGPDGTTSETGPSDATGNSRLLTLHVDHCDFGYLLPNGCGGDGGSHDFYINCMWLNVNDSHFYGDLADWRNWGICPPLRFANTVISGYAGAIVNPTTSGNCMKARARYMSIANCWVRANSGKWIDRPEGGDTTVANTIFSTIEQSTNLVLAYNSENTYPSTPMSDVVFTGCTFHMNREASYGGVWWNRTTTAKFDCSDAGNHLVWASPSTGLVVNRSNASYGPDASAFSGMTADYVLRGDGGGYVASPTATVAPTPAAPLPASLKGGDTLGPGIGPIVP